MRVRKITIASVIVTLTISLIYIPGSAINDGELDGDDHPYVGLMVADAADGTPMWRCSGTLLSPIVFLTAGHCTDGAARATIWFDSDVENGIPDNGYPFEGPNTVDGTPFTHPSYNPAAFFVFDLGVVILDTPVYMDEYGTLPELDVLDAMATQRGQQDVSFTSVGYGRQQISPYPGLSLKIRMVAHPHLIQINVPGFTGDFSILLSNNAATGGTCYGDSGGPNFIGNTNVIAGVTSFGINSQCGGTGGVYRVDRADDLNWLYGTFGDLF